jgi:DNA polymerase-3 subunit epsilon
LFDWIWGYEAKRQRLLKKVPDGVLKDFLSVPFPDRNTPFAELDILSVDFETTGLHAVKDKLLSVGFVTLSKQQIDIGSSFHQIIKTNGFLAEKNVTIHHITDTQKEQGEALEKVIAQLLMALAGKVMLVHFAAIEKKFLREACMQLYGFAPDIPIIDTLAIEKKFLDKRSTPYDPSELRLAALRRKYQLPVHHAHNALNDAIATAELLLAEVSHQSKTKNNNEIVRLKSLLL